MKVNDECCTIEVSHLREFAEKSAEIQISFLLSSRETSLAGATEYPSACWTNKTDIVFQRVLITTCDDIFLVVMWKSYLSKTGKP